MAEQVGRCLMPKLTSEQIEQYYRIRLDSYKLHHTKGMEYRSRCPFHDSTNPTVLWVDLAEGNYACFGCGTKGGSPFAFEQAMLKQQSGSSQAPMHDEVKLSLEVTLGTPFVQRIHEEPLPGRKTGWNRKQARDSYQYTDELGEEVFTVWRFVDRSGNKTTPPDHPCPCQRNPDAECEDECTDGRVWGYRNVRRVLFRLHDVIQASLVFVVEGEKNAKDLSRHLAAYIAKHGAFPFGRLHLDRVAVTTNPGGASQWKQEYGFGKFFQSKIVIKLGDNDPAGRIHDRDACADIAPYALQLYTLPLPVGEGEDVSDFLERESIDKLLKLLPNRQPWNLPARNEPKIAAPLESRVVLVKPSELVLAGALAGGDWLVEGLIERGTRGLVVAPPKTGKSLLFLELVICLANGKSFLGAKPYPRPVKCAVISREDGPVIVHRRLTQLGRAHNLEAYDLDRNILVNTDKQSATFKIDRAKDLDEMAEWLRAGGWSSALSTC